MATVEIRATTADDFAAMSTVYRRASLSNEGDRPHLLANPAYLELSDAAVLPGRSLIAVVEGRVVGFATVDPVDDGLELEALFVDPDWMRHRVGTALLAAVAERARRTGAFDDHRQCQRARRSSSTSDAGFLEVGVVELEFGPAPRMVLPVSLADDERSEAST